MLLLEDKSFSQIHKSQLSEEKANQKYTFLWNTDYKSTCMGISYAYEEDQLLGKANKLREQL